MSARVRAAEALWGQLITNGLTISIEESAEIVSLIIEAARAELSADVDEGRRFQAAKAAMQGYRSNPDIANADDALDATIIEWSVRDADALLAELAKTRGPV